MSRKGTSQPEEFENQGLLRWERIRANWLKPKNGDESKQSQRGEVRAKNIDVEDVIERIFSQSGGGALPEPVPLGQMVDILIDFWEADGLYD